MFIDYLVEMEDVPTRYARAIAEYSAKTKTLIEIEPMLAEMGEYIRIEKEARADLHRIESSELAELQIQKRLKEEALTP